jgi:hypothetical protein
MDWGWVYDNKKRRIKQQSFVTTPKTKTTPFWGAVFLAGRADSLLVYWNLDDLFLNRVRN